MPWPISPAPATSVRSRSMAASLASGRPVVVEDAGQERVGGGVRIEPMVGDGGERLARSSARTGSRRGAGPGAGRRRSPRPGPRPGRAAPSRRAPVVDGRPVPVERGEQLRDAGAGRGGRDQDLGPLRPGPRPRSVAVAVGRRPPAGRTPATSIARSWAAVRWAPGLSPLFTTTRSATSSRPALIAWTSSPISGASRTTVVSAAAATSTSLWPGPDGLDEDEVEADRVEDRRRGAGRRGEAAGVAARGHRADEDVPVARRRPASGRGRRAARRR